MRYSFPELLIFFRLDLGNAYCLKLISHYNKGKGNTVCKYKLQKNPIMMKKQKDIHFLLELKFLINIFKFFSVS